MIQLVPMTNEEYQAYAPRSMQNYAEEISRVHDMAFLDAIAQAEATFRRLLPEGRPEGPDQHLFTVLDEAGSRVGFVWFGIRRDRRTPYGYIWDIVLEPEFRGRGLGEQVLHEVEERIKALGYNHVALNVFGHNLAARRLYERMGYQVASLAMGKDL